MLKRLDIENFKCYAKTSVEFGGLTVLAGANGTGKSTIIQALLVVRQSLIGGKPAIGDQAPLNGRLVRLGTMLDVMPGFLTGRDAKRASLRLVADDGEVMLGMERNEGGYDSISAHISDFFATTESFGSAGFVFLSADRVGPQISYPVPEESMVNPYGNRGDCAVNVLDLFSGKPLGNRRIVELSGENEDDTLLGQLNSWMGEIRHGIRVSTRRHDDIGQVALSYSFWDGSTWSKEYSPVNVGFGFSHVLPIYVALLRAMPGDIVIVENPEAHLHPSGQTAMGRFLSCVASSGVQVIVETHSEHVLDGMRLAVKNGDIPCDYMAVRFVTSGSCGAQIDNPKVMPSGRMDIWPEGFFDEYEKVQMQLF